MPTNESPTESPSLRIIFGNGSEWGMVDVRLRDRHLVRAILSLALVLGCAPVRVHQTVVPWMLRPAAIPLSGHVARSEVEELEAQVASNPTPLSLLTLSTLHAKLARQVPTHDRARAIAHHRAAAVYASFALADPGLEPQARALHSEGVAGCVRNSRALIRTKKARGQWANVLREHGIEPVGTVIQLTPGRIDDLMVAGDMVVSGMNHHYKAEGVGCPLVAYRRIEEKLDLQDEFYQEELNLPATAVLIAEGSPWHGDWRNHPVRLILHDPLRESTVKLAGRQWRLASDLTTPLAREQATTARDLAKLDWLGLLNPQKAAEAAGLFMLTPFQPGKIPVVLIHGLGSGPESWTQIVNDIQGDPQLREKYQVWMVRYATGNALILSALQVRKEIQRARETFDPSRTDPSFDQMVVIGHSLGGLMTKTLVIESGEDLWNARFTVPLWAIKGSPQLRSLITEAYSLRPHDEVKRVVFIATPHQGSRLANLGIFQFLADLLIQQTDQLSEARKELVAMNGRGVFQKGSSRRSINVMDSVTFGNPVIEALSNLRVVPHVASHSIIANVFTRAPIEQGTDLVVSYESAHLGETISEHIVESTHFCLEKVATSNEIKRILYEHLGQPMM